MEREQLLLLEAAAWQPCAADPEVAVPECQTLGSESVWQQRGSQGGRPQQQAADGLAALMSSQALLSQAGGPQLLKAMGLLLMSVQAACLCLLLACLCVSARTPTVHQGAASMGPR